MTDIFEALDRMREVSVGRKPTYLYRFGAGRFLVTRKKMPKPRFVLLACMKTCAT